MVELFELTVQLIQSWLCVSLCVCVLTSVTQIITAARRDLIILHGIQTLSNVTVSSRQFSTKFPRISTPRFPRTFPQIFSGHSPELSTPDIAPRTFPPRTYFFQIICPLSPNLFLRTFHPDNSPDISPSQFWFRASWASQPMGSLFNEISTYALQPYCRWATVIQYAYR